MTETDLDAILEVARWSGSSMNRQPLTFIVIRDQADLVRLAKLAPNAGHLGEAGLAIAIATRDGQPSASSSPQERSVSGPQSRATA